MMLFLTENTLQILRRSEQEEGHSFRKGVPFKWSKPKPVCGISVVKREIAVFFTTAISILEGGVKIDIS